MKIKQAHSLLLASFALVCLLLLAGASLVAQRGVVLETNLQAMLPADNYQALRSQARTQIQQQYGDGFVLLLEECDQQKLEAATQALADALTQSGFIQLLDINDQQAEMRGHLEKLAPYRFTLLSEAQRKHLANPEAFLQTAYQGYFSLGNQALLTPIDDPLQLFSQYVTGQLESEVDAIPVGKYLQLTDASSGKRQNLILARMAQPGFDISRQQQLLALMESWRTSYPAADGGPELYRSGAIFHAAEAASSARREISVIGGVSILAIIGMFIACFRSLAPLLAALGSLAFGCSLAFVSTQLIYGSLHLITLVFGAGLLGVAIDYALHYTVRAWSTDNATRLSPLSGILGSLGLALLTSIVGYACLFQAPLPSLQQIALFSVVGLAGAWLFTVALFPYCIRRGQKTLPVKLAVIAQLPQSLWKRVNNRSFANVYAVGLIAVAILVFSQLNISDDVRTLHRPSATLIDSESHIQQLTEPYSPNQFFLVTADTQQGVLENLESLSGRFNQLVEQGIISGYRSITHHIPSEYRQAENYALLDKNIYNENSRVAGFMQALGFNQEAINQHLSIFANAKGKKLTLEQWLDTAPANQKMLWLDSPAQPGAIVLLKGITELTRLDALAHSTPSLIFIDEVGKLSHLLQNKTRDAIKLLMLAYLAVAGLMLLRYRIIRCLWLVSVPFGATLLVFLALVASGTPLTLFHAFALFLVMGLGMDYVIFLYGSINLHHDDHQQDTMVAVSLAAVTSFLSFGLLSLSSTPMVAAFGQAVLLGVLANLVFSPVLVQRAQSKQIVAPTKTG